MNEEQTTTSQAQEVGVSQADKKDEIKSAEVSPDTQSQVDPRIKAELEEARKEAARYRTQLRTVEQKLSEYEQEKLTEQEKLAKRAEEAEKKATELQERLNAMQVEHQIVTAAQRAGVIDVDAVVRLIDRSSLKVDETGKIENLDEALKALLKQKPYLLAAPNAQASNPQRSATEETVNPILQHMKGAMYDPFDPSAFRKS